MTTERNEWEFEVPATELVEKCNEKVAHHKERVKYYDGQHKELREKYVQSVREAAQNATEKEAKDAEEWATTVAYLDDGDFDRMSKTGLAGASSSTHPVPQRREIMGDPEIYAELQRALGKLNEHRSNVETYARWGKLLERDSDEATRPLTYNDAVFFGL